MDINKRIQGVTFDSEIESNLQNSGYDAGFSDEEFDPKSNEIPETNDLTVWVDDIQHEAQELVSADDHGDRDNILENKPFANYFARLCKQKFPLFSGTSRKFFNSPYSVGSSWSSETHFKNVKQLHGDEIPCSVDQFLKRDLQLSNASVIKASQKMLSKSNVVTTLEEENGSEHENENFESDDEIVHEPHQNSVTRNDDDTSTECIACMDGFFSCGKR